jgi:hypothetical protein
MLIFVRSIMTRSQPQGLPIVADVMIGVIDNRLSR